MFALRIARWIFRTILLAISLCSGVLGAHGLYAYYFKTHIIVGVNADKLFLIGHIPSVYLKSTIEQVTIRSSESLILPIILMVIGLVTWITHSSMAQRPGYTRVRFSSPTQVSPMALFLVVAGVAASGYIIANWESMDKSIAVLVLAANAMAIIWNLSIFRH